MTAAAAATLASIVAADAIAKDCPERAHPLPLHNAPSLHDLLALKRQRCSLDEGSAEPQLSGDDAPRASELSEERSMPDAGAPSPGCGEAESAKAEATQVDGFLVSPTFAVPLLPAVLCEPMSGYFLRLRGWLPSSSSQPHPQSELRAVASLQLDGIYLHKRPIRAPNGTSPLAVCGSVLHHVLVLVKQGPLLHSLDFGPANGADVTANILEEAPPKKILVTATTTTTTGTAATTSTAPPGPADDAPVAAAGATASVAAPGAAQDELPYLYLGKPACDVDHPLVQQLISFAECRPYHALRNNCIHFADTLVRVLTAGAVRAAPLLYDMTCGSVPAADNPMLLMMQLMLQMPWFVVVDGSPLTAAFLEHWRAGSEGETAQPPPQPHQPKGPRGAAADAELRNNSAEDAAAAAGSAAGAAPATTSSAVIAPVLAAGAAREGATRQCTSECPAASVGVSGEPCHPQQQQQRQQRHGSDPAAQADEGELQADEGELQQEQENDNGLCKAQRVQGVQA